MFPDQWWMETLSRIFGHVIGGMILAAIGALVASRLGITLFPG
jgi:hypothetical protein